MDLFGLRRIDVMHLFLNMGDVRPLSVIGFKLTDHDNIRWKLESKLKSEIRAVVPAATVTCLGNFYIDVATITS